jgi:hypothetical protein
MAWRDLMTPYDVSVAGLTSEGSAIFYGVDCPVMNPLTFYPKGACSRDSNCNSVYNTECRREENPVIAANTTISLLTCQCQDGFEPIPSKFAARRCIHKGQQRR